MSGPDNVFSNFAPILDDSAGVGQTVEDQQLPLPQLLTKIIAQRGSFLDITEEKLQQEIEAQQSGSEETVKKKEQETEKEQEFSSENFISQEDFLKQKETIINSVHSALNESSLSLDFVSLLISCVRPAAGSSSMSPHLKQHIKIGSLSSDKVEPPEDTEKLQFDISRVGRGWKLESLERASKNLKNSSLRLKEEVAKEKNFWTGMVEVLKSNEVITSMNIKNTKEICVKYGYGDAGSTYYDKGIGLLKKDPTSGDLTFGISAPTTEEKTDKLVNVKLYTKTGDKLTLIAESNLQDRIGILQKEGIINEIAKARYYLFEEELFYQLLREAATLISLQVTIDEDKILIDLHDEIVEISQVAPENVQLPEQSSSNERAELIQIYLRLMLYAEHKRNLDQRKIPPLSLNTETTGASQTFPSSIIRPMIVYNRHERSLKTVQDVLESVITVQLDNDRTRATTYLKENLQLTKNLNEPKGVVDPFSRVLTPPASVLELPINNLKIRVKLNSLINSAHSTINLDLETDTGSSLLGTSLNDARELEDCLNWAIREHNSDQGR
ncbi:hypothetical protein OGAPHI_000624 [Ogataea philodendri]|uniref:Mediator of RNA polymerase II transcription subunit 17 n=1 Tax=Ogataea philodendri TaxID=1378263 RepID=A0A9P8PER6_9ASCO|nr:uncharacterized protein OGAPHI_000624 [Ogataea philodendri]KAH3670913.1 hypothetical protein OGAPHI_000624 [Ogataea philodendri]